ERRIHHRSDRPSRTDSVAYLIVDVEVWTGNLANENISLSYLAAYLVGQRGPEYVHLGPCFDRHLFRCTVGRFCAYNDSLYQIVRLTWKCEKCGLKSFRHRRTCFCATTYT